MNRKELGKFIWERFAVVERSKKEFGDIYLPNNDLINWRRFFISKSGDDLTEDLAFRRFVTPEDFRDNQEIIGLVDSVIDSEVELSDLTNRISKKDINTGVREFLERINYQFEADGNSQINVSIQAGNYDVILCFNMEGHFPQLDYRVKVYHAGDVQKFSNLKYGFLAEYLWGCGCPKWDCIESDQILQESLEEMFGLCERLAEVFKEIKS